MHQELYLARGVQKTPGDALSAEQGLDAINLLDSTNGFSVDPIEGWIPQIAGLKSGGVWADSAVNTGRLLIAGEDGNVIETIRLTVSAGDNLSVFKQVARLNRFIQNCRQMWTTFYQIEPVFLWWWAQGAPGRQYALIFNIDLTVTYPGTQQGAIADVVLTLEREPYWRALPPGMNPIIWAYNARSEKMDSITDFDLIGGTTNHFAYDAGISNRHEWSSAGVVLTKNYMDIDGDRIPGDAPALAAVGVNWSGGNASQIHIARTTRPLSYPERAFGITPAGTLYRFGMLNATNAGLGTDATDAADTGAVLETTSGTRERVNISFATATANTRRLAWEAAADFDLTTFSGKFAVFARARQVNGAFGDCLIQLRAATGTLSVVQTFDQVPVTLSGTTGNTSGWPIHYLGSLTLPFNSRADVRGDGQGIATGIPALGSLQLWAERLTGTGVVYICDLILMPFDEEYIKIITLTGVGNPNEIVDTTGYISHGETLPVAIGYNTLSGEYIQEDFPEIQGNGITLAPGVDNRLYFWAVNDAGSGSLISDPLLSLTVKVDIIPRWRGVRDA